MELTKAQAIRVVKNWVRGNCAVCYQCETPFGDAGFSTKSYRPGFVQLHFDCPNCDSVFTTSDIAISSIKQLIL